MLGIKYCLISYSDLWFCVSLLNVDVSLRSFKITSYDFANQAEQADLKNPALDPYYKIWKFRSSVFKVRVSQNN